MKSKLNLLCKPEEATFDAALLDCRPEEAEVEEKIDLFAKRNTVYIESDRVEKGAILCLNLSGDHPRSKNGTAEIAVGFNLFCEPLESALLGAGRGDVVTVQTEQGTLNATVCSIKIPQKGIVTDEAVRAANIPGVQSVTDYRRYVQRTLAEKKRDRNKFMIFSEKSENMIARSEIMYDNEEHEEWLRMRLADELKRMREHMTESEFENAQKVNKEHIENWLHCVFDQLMLENALAEQSGLPADATEAEKRSNAKHLLLEGITFIME